MKTDIQIFKNEKFGEVRVTEVNGQTYFVGSDVAKALGYEKPYNAIKQHVDNQDTLKRGISDNQGVPHEYVLVNESGVYSLIFGSKLESAKDFKRWVTSDVLPVIRKHGGYLTPQTIEEVLLSPDTIIRLATDLKEERQKRLDAETLIEIQKPKVKYYDEVLSSDNLMTVTEIAKNYGWSADALNGILRGIGVQYKRGAKWFLKAKYQDKDYVRIVPVVVDAKNGNQIIRNDMKWTETGRKFIHEILVSKGHINRQQSF